MSLSIWFKTNSYYTTNYNWAILISKSGYSLDTNSRQFSLYYRDNGDIYFNNDVVGNFSFNLNVWYNITITYNSGQIKTYVNGQLISTTSTTNIITSNQLSLMFGYDRPGLIEFYDGALDDIRIYNSVLTPTEISTLVSEPSTCTPLSDNDFNLDKNSIKLYPNPAKDYIYVSNLNITRAYEIYNVLDSKIMCGTISRNEKINVKNFKTGLYILKFDNGSTFKFIKE